MARWDEFRDLCRSSLVGGGQGDFVDAIARNMWSDTREYRVVSLEAGYNYEDWGVSPVATEGRLDPVYKFINFDAAQRAKNLLNGAHYSLLDEVLAP